MEKQLGAIPAPHNTHIRLPGSSDLPRTTVARPMQIAYGVEAVSSTATMRTGLDLQMQPVGSAAPLTAPAPGVVPSNEAPVIVPKYQSPVFEPDSENLETKI